MKQYILYPLLITLSGTISAGAQPAAQSSVVFTADSVRSADGTIIGYRKAGKGPAVLILHGTFEYWESHRELAEVLSNSFTVYLPDRRGRGSSPYEPNDYQIRKDIEDVQALIRKTCASRIFAVSSGAVILLNAALELGPYFKLALYEPPLAMDKQKAIKGLQRFDKEVSSEKLPDAMITAMQTAKLGPKTFDYMPRFILRSFSKKMLKNEAQPAVKGSVRVAQLIPTIHHDFALTIANLNNFNKYQSVRCEVLLMGGTKSPGYLKASLDRLASACPQFKRDTLKGLGHGGSGSSAWGGDPKRVAFSLTNYFN